MNKGFNLAEVLITLGILGVIIAMTLPTIIKNYRNKVLKQQFKVAYSIVYEAVKRMSVNNSDILNTYCGLNYTNTSIEARTRFGKDFSKYFDVVYDKTSDPNAYLTIYDNTRLKQPNYKKFDKLTDANGYNDGLFIIKNGMIIMNGHCWIGASNKKGQHVEFLIDINGKKGPNTKGRDLFAFELYSDGKVSEGYNTQTKINNCDATIPDGGYASGCFTKLIENNWRMDY